MALNTQQAAELIVQIALIEGARTNGKVPRCRLTDSFLKLGWRERDFDAGLSWAGRRAWLEESGELICLTPAGQSADVFTHLTPRPHPETKQALFPTSP